MNPQIKLLLVPSLSDQNQWFPVAASLEGFPWGSEEKALGVIAKCPDEIVGVDVAALLTALTEDDAPVQIQFPFQADPSAVVGTVSTGKSTQQTTETAVSGGRVSPPQSSWVVDMSGVDPGFLENDGEKPVMDAETLTSNLVNI